MFIQKIPRKTLAYISMGVGVLALSLSALFVRWSQAPGTVTAFYRMTIAGLVLLPFFLRLPASDRKRLNSYWYLPLIAGLCTAMDHGMWSTSIGMTRIANATLMNYISPLWVALFAWLVWHEKLSGKFWAGLAVTLLGTVVFFNGREMQGLSMNAGDLLAIGSSLFYAFYFLVTQRSRTHLRTLAYLVPVNWVAALALLGFNLASGHALTGYPTATWLTFLGAGLISQTIGYFSMSFALGSLPASIVSPTMIAAPVFTTLMAIPFAGEMPQINQWIGGLILLGGIYWVNRAQ
ncbi:permease of the drug/metabolite transporter (DMT) superfamily [Longilinea arvoryzae]|uniref:Permease of the drug/metabolite transporter (DMT) superfamily n=1 Tax=Longilinea arvoryzae TaxID=360412 RepID=A0A0S7BEB2_9CHLR|nr:DMT family transporter [Longilinea arvoryzae]GAP13869.1 permease of the drug/metabolite transporter (DMT) superfamily [Longilinea arvoryzae]